MPQREQVLDRAKRLQQAFVTEFSGSKHGTGSASIPDQCLNVVLQPEPHDFFVELSK